MLLLDSALGCAVHSTMPVGGVCATVSVEIKLVRPVAPDSGELLAEAHVVHVGRRLATAQGEVRRAADGVLVAHGVATCAILD
jgi:uncharacterized protein (TIGR00369 family)